MERVCEPCRKRLPQMGCEHERQWREIQSWKEVIELHHAELDKDYPEHLWVDSGEMELDGDTPMLDK